MITVPVFSNHNAIVHTQRGAELNAHPLGALVAGHQKDVVITAKLEAAPGKVAIYGWHQTNGIPIQPLYLKHAAAWVDYSQCTRLVQQEMLVNGQTQSITQVLANPSLCRLLSDEGVVKMFGNPGTTELPLNDALVEDRRIQYILGLQEVPVMAMADGYAMASGGLGVVNLHISCGLGNAMGMLYNAHREGTPLLVTAGQQDRRLKFEEPILTSDMVSVARPWTKWAAEIDRVEDLPSALRRAAGGPPSARRRKRPEAWSRNFAAHSR